MLRDPPRDRGDPNPSIRANRETNRCMIRGATKGVTKLPNNSSRRIEIQKDSRENIDPDMIKLAQICASHKGRAIMRNLNKVIEQTFPKASKGFMEVGYGSIRQEIIEPDSIVTKAEIPHKMVVA